MLNCEQSQDPLKANSKRQNKEPTSREVRGDDVTTVTGASSCAGEIFFVKLLFVAVDVAVEVEVEVDVAALVQPQSLLVFSEFCSTMVAVLVLVEVEVEELMN